MTAHILFVDDETSNVLVFEAVCGDFLPILTANSGAAALEIMQQYEVGVVVTDQRMPEMTGVELLEIVQERYPDVIRLLSTAYSDIDVAEDAINRGHVRRYLRKPWDPEMLKAEMKDSLDLYELNTKVKRLEQRLLEAERAYSMSVVASGIADELRSPVGWIRNSLNVLGTSTRAVASSLKDERPNVTRALGLLAQMENAVSDAQDGVKRILGLVEEISKGPAHAAEEVCDLAEAVRLAVRKAETSGLRGRTALEVTTGVAATVKGTRTHLVQITLNLLTSSMQRVATRTGGGGFVRVATAMLDDRAVLDIVDNGPPVKDDERAEIFRAFGNGRVIGPGVGLAISKRIAKELGGSLDVSATEQGETRFRLTLPPAPKSTQPTRN
jgi:two-component system NtrC family sensor kinase